MRILASVLIILLFAIAFWFFPKMPEMMVSHWGLYGEPNGYMPKFWGIFLLPILTLVLTALFFFLPKFDPLKKNIKKFEKYYNGLIIAIILFMAVLQAQIILWNLGIKIDMNIVMPLALGALFFYIGILLKHTERNWFIGIRTPWTLSSDKIWRKTHRLGGNLFQIAGILSIIGVIFRKYSFFIMIIPVILFALYTVIYSYLEFKKGKRHN